MIPSRAATALLLVTMSHLVAAGVSGSWIGPGLVVTLSQHGEELSGTVATADDTVSAPIERGQVRDDVMTFETRDSDNRVVKFRLKLTEKGTLTGESSVGDQVSEIKLSPAEIGYYPISGGLLRAQPVLVRQVQPEYTEGARGTVVLQVQINPDGRVAPTGIRVIRSLGFSLDEKAIEAAKQWKFKPATTNGAPVAAPATIEIRFRQ